MGLLVLFLESIYLEPSSHSPTGLLVQNHSYNCMKKLYSRVWEYMTFYCLTAKDRLGGWPHNTLLVLLKVHEYLRSGSSKLDMFYYPPEVKRGERLGFGVFLLQYIPLSIYEIVASQLH